MVITQAVREEVVHQKESSQEQFYQSLANRSGVFVKEFRELESPYEREEFIMSIHLNQAFTEQITKEK